MKMKPSTLHFGFVLGVLVLFLPCDAKPVKRGPPQPKPVEGDSPEESKDTGLPYDAYLKQVVDVLESDPEFRKKLETANISDIKSGKIAMYLELVNHTVRTSLDEIKRREIKRLQDLMRIQVAAMSGNGVKDLHIPTHLDIRNQHSFEMKDLEILIKKTTDDLEELDKKRREDFKEYEMEKEYEKRQKLQALDEEHKKKEEERLENLKKKHSDHPKLNHPGSKDQFEEVWDKVDHLEDQEFNPKTFFFKHDLNGDMQWNIEEVDAVLQLELDKVYDSRNSPDEDDPYERQEEMNRMREHVFTEMDKDKNRHISFEEFIEYTGDQGENEDFKKDDGWETLDEQEPFTDEDYLQYVQSHHAQPGVAIPPAEPELRFQPEHQAGQPQPDMQQHQQQFQHQQQQFQQQQQQFRQQQHPHIQENQQFQQLPPHHQQQQFQQPLQHQQQFQQPSQQQQFQQQPSVQQQEHPPQQQHQQFQQPPQQQLGQQQQQQYQQVPRQQQQIGQGNQKHQQLANNGAQGAPQAQAQVGL